MFIDLHMHSRFSRACSGDINLQNLESHARMKGIDVLATGDITHPTWVKELKSLDERDGLLVSKTGFHFFLSGEVSNIYQQDGQSRRVHNLVLVRNFEILDAMNSELEKYGKLSSDGRPILKMSSSQLIEALKNIDRTIEVIPAHIWTPWFSVFGSKSGFDSIKDCFQDMAKHIFALENGLSADPQICSLISGLDKYSIVSFSDSHSHWPLRIGREATNIESDFSFEGIVGAMKGKNINNTVEFYPQEGKYHYDGHRNCRFSSHPSKTPKDGKCPRCGGALTLGVLNRILELADRETPVTTQRALHAIPLQEIISFAFNSGPHGKAVWEEYEKAIHAFGSEFNVLFNAGEEELKDVLEKRVHKALMSVRNGDVSITPGYDGEYGKLSVGGQVRR
ncbi:MAG: DNA helicase UvrD [Candidatus Aenigmarchaeota archaeon]|nr:DNA helicase UvrD [Candidatus Aenigmarchaeota archaeon]